VIKRCASKKWGKLIDESPEIPLFELRKIESRDPLILVEREGLEPAKGTHGISNLLTSLEFASLPLPSDAQIWHRI
jgi:hypothetical protein